jgi:predicted DNA-binding transcriptional regulator AlpA
MSSDKTPLYSIELGRISQALISSGYTSLDEQAKALGVHRSTAWTIIKNKHKVGRLSAKTIDRILSNPQTPPPVRMVIRQYVDKRFKRKLTFSLKAPSENK